MPGESSAGWSSLISAWRSSGKNMADWCRDNGISYRKFKYRYYKYYRPQEFTNAGKFIPAKLEPPSSGAPSLQIECNGLSVHLSSGFDPLLLKQVISVLREI